MKNIRLILFMLPVLLASLGGRAQTYGNEWINYANTYYKFKVGKDGVYRITKAALDAAGVPAVTGAQFRLFRDGKEVPLYVSTSGSFGSSDFIEFYGRKADGRLDSLLYETPGAHPNNRISLFTDTAAYFLTYDSPGNQLRFTEVPTNIPSGPPAALSYCMATVGVDFLRNFSSGRNVVLNEHIPLSVFDRAEGYVDTIVTVHVPLSASLATSNVANASANATVRFSAVRTTQSSSAIPFKAFLNGQNVLDAMLQPDATNHYSFSVAAALLNGNNNFQFVPTPSTAFVDNYGVSFIEVKYPRNFDMGGADFFSFSLNASSSAQYLEFSNFQTGSGTPRLLDLTNLKWYAADLSVAGKARFYIDPSFTSRDLVLYAPGAVAALSAVKTFQFTDYNSGNAQGDYIIISHGNYASGSQNYLQQYRDYRSSANGGNHTVVLADVDELYDQFAYGQDVHPLAVRRFLQFAYDRWQAVRPHDVFIIGKGLLYHRYRSFLANRSAYPYAAIVPTWGDIGADMNFVNFLPGKKQAMNIGRLTAWNAQEIGIYLDKVKSYEIAMKPAALPTHGSELWKKQVLHIVGGKDYGEQNGILLPTMQNAAAIISDTAFGGKVTTIAKNTTNPIDNINNKSIDSQVNNGLSLISFHGHATPNGFELNLNNPESYNSAPRFPHFIALGCDVAQIFSLTTSLRTVSERYLTTPNGGSMTMIASNNLQYPSFHSKYLTTLYHSMSRRNYGASIGDHHHYAYDSLRGANNSEFDYFHLESMILQGDPALPVFHSALPDYHVSADRLATIPANVTTNADSFQLKVIAFNLGRAVRDTVRVQVEHINPAGVVTTTRVYGIANLFTSDTTTLKLPLNKLTDIGLNKLRVTIDYNSRFAETSEANNVATLDLFIYSDNLIPVYPKEFAIVHQQGITLKASTLNPFRKTGRYRLEIDTTELFNSPIKESTLITSGGGVIKWKPSMTFKDSTVYYWRTAFDSLDNGSYQWSVSSFIYLANGSPGWNQSQYYQYLRNSFTGLDYGSDRTFRFNTGENLLTVHQAVFSEDGTTPWNTADFAKVMMNGADIQRLGCWPWDGTIQVMVFDSMTTAPWRNDSTFGTGGAYPSCPQNRNIYAFEFPVWEPTGRNNAKRFLDSVPNGHYVLVRNIINLGKYTDAFAEDWKADTTINGPGQSLYHTLYNMGFSQIDSFNQKRVFIFFRKKGDNSFPVHQYFGKDLRDTLQRNFILPYYRKSGSMASTVIGPAKEWQQLNWQFSATDNRPQNDKPYVAIHGMDNNGVASLLYEGYAQDTSLSFIDAAQYPLLRLTWTSYDSIDVTSPQLRHWRVLYAPVPEAALNPAAHLSFSDSLHVGQMQQFSVAIENLTEIPMDSMLVRYKVIDENSITHVLSDKRYKKLGAEDTLHASFTFDPASYPGSNVFFIEANPDNDQPEQYHPNNLGYLPFDVITDKRNPLLDVTFDGVHILDRDIVSSKPFIKITLKDENKYMALDDTSLLLLRIRYPNANQTGTPEVIPFDGTVCKFIPAVPGDRNEAVIEYRPTFLQDGIYEMMVNGRDKTGNVAGNTDYQISFEVINKSSITNILNYPNPFSTSTAFVFTLTGSEIPTQFKIQILTVTGKVVREITRQELGPIHIGRNITEYKWDGRDQYGQLLGNGVYLYRVVTNINGAGIEHRQSGADRFYKNGYGKMYIMR